MFNFFEVLYPNVFVLMEHLVRMGEGLASVNRKLPVGKETFLAMAAAYQRKIFFDVNL